MGKQEIEIKNPAVIILLVILSLVFFLEVRVTLNTPIAFGDEGFHTRMAQWIEKEKEYPVWIPFEGTEIYKENFARPPLWNFLEAGFFLIMGFHEIIVKVLTPFIATFMTGLVVFILGKKIFNEEIAFIASIIMVTVPSFVTYSVLFYTDIFFTFVFTSFVLCIMLALKENEKKYWILSIIFASFSILTKTPGFVVLIIFGLVFLYELYKTKKIKIIKKYIPVIIMMALICGPWVLRNINYYKTPVCAALFKRDTCKQTFDYEVQTNRDWAGRTTPTGSEQSVIKMGIVNYMNFAYGSMFFIPLFFLCGLYLILKERNIKNILLIIVLISFIPVLAISTTRAEDTARYMLGILVGISFAAAIYLEKIYKFIKKYYKNLSFIVFILVIAFGFWGMNQKLKVMNSVKQFSPSFFEACDWIEQNTPEDALLFTVWGHRATYNCQRSISIYGSLPDSKDIILSYNLDLVYPRLIEEGITHVFVQKFSIDQTPYGEKYPVEFVLLLENNPDHFKKVYENGPVSSQCFQGGCDGNIVYEVIY